MYISLPRTAQTDFIETFESKTYALAHQCFHFQNGLNPSFMPTQQRPNRALTESSADQFYLIRQLNFQKLVLASQFLFARYFLRLAREVVPNFGVYCRWQINFFLGFASPISSLALYCQINCF
ncbi:Hypothetical_protein [Hexamita inflata]|uniref:Hypothetical_protein n=1 Tax=Hexamita inflata TaxID=28002 RepID=A0ABP1HK94_9EUKA